MTKDKIIAWIYVVLWSAVIFFFSSIPHLKIEQLGVLDFILRKLAHVTEYMILSVLYYRAFVISTRLESKRVIFYSIILSILYAVSDEFHQHFVPGRCFMVSDIIIDTVGVITGIVLAHKYKHRLVRLEK